MEERNIMIVNKLEALLQDYVEIDGKLDPNMSLVNDIGIDSFGLVCLIGSIEEEFGIEIPSDKLGKFQTVSDMVAYISTNSSI